MITLSKGMALALALGASCVLGDLRAAAQTSNKLPGSPAAVLNFVSVADIVAMMGEMGIATSVVQGDAGGSPAVVAQAPEGGRFIFRLVGCEAPAEGRNCKNVFVMTGMPNAGLSYDDINSFNGEAVVTVAVNVPDQRVVLFGRNIIVFGGHSRDLFMGTVYLFLQDVERFYAARQGAAASVSYDPRPGARGKIDWAAVGENAPVAVFGFTDFHHEIAAAIAHSSGVGFSVDYTPAD